MFIYENIKYLYDLLYFSIVSFCKAMRLKRVLHFAGWQFRKWLGKTKKINNIFEVMFHYLQTAWIK